MARPPKGPVILTLRLNGAPGAIRTRDLLVRSQTLYPTELRAHFGAGDGIRTRDINLGKVALYQLSYSRLVGYFLILSGSACSVNSRNLNT